MQDRTGLSASKDDCLAEPAFLSLRRCPAAASQTNPKENGAAFGEAATEDFCKMKTKCRFFLDFLSVFYHLIL